MSAGGKNTHAGRKATSFPVACIGGSAGGLEAFRDLLKNMPDKPGMALVFIMHLAPDYKSMLAQMLARDTKMPVTEAKNNMPVKINHVYVIPPNRNMFMAGGKIRLSSPRDLSSKHMPVDLFFRSLAEEQGNRAIGVILSGTATDGTLGAETIKAESGIVFAQDEESAKYNGMPQSAINAGCVDFVLSPAQIARELVNIAKHPYVSRALPDKIEEFIDVEGKEIEGILNILRVSTGLDFTHYKAATIGRRVSRRMILQKLKNLKDYLKFLRGNKDEVWALYEDLLINVTSFFREPKVFDALKKQVLPAILKNRIKDQSVRIWVPACSSGEEPYSIAICLLELLGNKADSVPIQIFATDVNENSINKARKGVYGKKIENEITPERLKRFFTKDGNSYKISKQLREICVFSRQNVFGDPLFSNIDLISCRNLLIYLKPVLQKRVFEKIHYALKPNGFLLLGNSESASGYSNLFKALDKKYKIFMKKYLPGRLGFEFGPKYYLADKIDVPQKADIKKITETDITDIADKIVLNEYGPCGVLIDGNMEVVQFRGNTGRYLESASGRPSFNIFKLARKGMLIPLRLAIDKARKTKNTVKRESVDVKHNGRGMRVDITIIPVKSKALKEEFFLALFEEAGKAATPKNLQGTRGKYAADENYIESLQKELSETKKYLQSVTEDQESANEEVKTANEEIMSSNEELQSTNEELETAKEELQSSNEELITANEELQNRNAEISQLSNDLINLLTSINIPLVMTGIDLVVRRITPQAEKILNITYSDIGRPISKIKLSVEIPDLDKILLDVIESLHPKTFEIKGAEEKWYSVFIRPYRTTDNKIDGAVATFVDITERRNAQDALRKVNEEIKLLNKGLEKRVREKIGELNESQIRLMQADKMAAAGVMAAGVAHELNSPLTGLIMLLNGYLKEKDPNGEECRTLKEMKNACERMAEIIKNFSVFAKPQTVEYEKLNINEAIEECLSFSVYQLEKKNVNIEKNYASYLPKVTGNNGQLQQVVINMITNACDAITGKGKLEIATRAVDVGNKCFVEMEFSDNGCGIKKEYVDKIFDPFFTMKESAGGTGLGLTIVSKIIRDHNGFILVDSEEGKGSTFKIRLPVSLGG